MSPHLEGPLAREIRKYVEDGHEMPRPPARRHHVPAFLLARFAGPCGMRRGWLRQLDKRSGKPGRTTPNDGCFGIDLYTQASDDDTNVAIPDTRVEMLFSIVEKHAAPALQRLVADPLGLTAEDRQTLSYFLAFQYTRTPPAITDLERTAQVLADLHTGLSLEHSDFSDTYRTHIDRDANESQVEAARRKMLRQFLDGDVIVRAPNAALFTIVSTADALAEAYYGLEWLVAEADPGVGEFVTSDRALAIVDPTPKFPWSGDAPASSPSAQTTVPLDPHHVLVVQSGPPRVGRTTAPRETVTRINLRTYGWAERFIYGNKQKTVQDVRTAAKQNRRAVPTPRVAHQVIVEEADPDDPTVGREHLQRGWPRGLWYTGNDGHERFMAYHVLKPGDRRGNHAALVDDLGARGRISRAPSDPVSG